MSKKFLSPIKHAQGDTLPATGTAGEQFYLTTDQKVYTHNGTTWTASSGGGGNSFETIAVPSGTNPVASSPTDTLTLAAGSGITITGDSATDTVTIAASAPTGFVSQTDGTVTTASISSGVVRNIYTSTSNPTGGMDGDVWMVYT